MPPTAPASARPGTTKATAQHRVWTPDSHDTWTGCVTDRTQNYDTTNTAPTSGNARRCSRPSSTRTATTAAHKIATIMPLSYDWAALKTKIDTLVPTGNTNQGIGLAWGWMTLTQTRSLQRAGQGSELSLQGCDRHPVGRFEHAEPLVQQRLRQIDARQKILCDNAKAAGITIYTVQVNTGGDPTSAVLQYCAQQHRKLLPGHLGHRRRRRCSTRSAHSSPSCASRNKRRCHRQPTKKPGSRRAFSFRKSRRKISWRPA